MYTFIFLPNFVFLTCQTWTQTVQWSFARVETVLDSYPECESVQGFVLQEDEAGRLSKMDLFTHSHSGVLLFLVLLLAVLPLSPEVSSPCSWLLPGAQETMLPFVPQHGTLTELNTE